MFGLFRRPTARPLTDAIRRAIEKDGMTAPVSNPSELRMVESRGRYSDRKVTYFRIFDPTSAAQRSMDIQRYQDFDVFPGLILRSGHVEHDGMVILTRPVTVRAADTPSRTHADRTLHADDAHIIRGETGATANSGTVAPSVSEQAL
jgi:hypothetical protein